MKSTEHGQFDQAHGGKLAEREPARNSRTSFSAGRSSFHVATLRWLPAVASLALILAALGCQSINLPRIDPTGSRIFLPFPNTTQLTPPRLHESNGEPGLLPTPAFQEPAAPAPCIDGGEEGGVCNMFKNKLVGHIQDKYDRHYPGKCGEIQLTPLRVVAPVGGEVVLLAGICGEDGFLVKREPLEWMLTPDSVGTFIEVGDDNTSRLVNTLRQNPKIEKLDVDFARGRTSNRETLITRGTKKTDDDIKLKEGQTWLSISSPSEGLSRVTVLAPESEIWDRRRQTATIYWVDAQWEFPQPQIARSGEGITLLTRVTRAENLKPAAGWTVLYTIADPSVATFVPPADIGSGRVQISGNSAKVRVDENGQAIVQVSAPPGARGTTPIVIEVIRPAEPSDNLPELLLGRGQTVVTFSSPGLVLQAFGPETGNVGEQLTYSLSLANPGDIDAENVRLLFQIPAGMKLIATSMQAGQVGDVLTWEQGVLAAQRQLDVSIVLEAQQQGDFVAMVRADGQPNLSAEKSLATRIVLPSVTVRFEPVGGVAQAEVGSVINYEIDVTNSGRQTLTDLKILIESDPGMPEFESSDYKVEQTIPMLQPAQTTRLGVAFKVQQEGQFGAKLRVTSGNALLAETPKSFVRGVLPKPKQPGIVVNVAFPETIAVGRRANALVTIKNTGETTLTGLRVAIANDPALRAVSVDNGNISRVRQDGGQLIWSPQDLMRGTTGDSVIQMLVEFEALSPVAQASISAQAVSAENVQSQSQTFTRIIAAEVQPPAADAAPNSATQPRSGELQLKLNDYNDPRAVNQEIRYSLTITNRQNLSDRNIRLQLRIPQGLALGKISSMTGDPITFRRDNDVYELQPLIQFMRPEESITYIFIAVGLVPGLVEISARVASDGQPNWQTISEQTTIVPAAR